MTMSLATIAPERDVVLEQWADSVIEAHRFGSSVDRVLARWDEEDVDVVMPSADDLASFGFDIVGLAKALEAGLDPVLFGKAYRLLDLDEFNQVLVAHGAGLDITLYNEGLAHLAEIAAADA